MRKIIDIDEQIIPKLKIIAAIEGSSVKKIMEKAIIQYIEQKQKEQMDSLSLDQKEDLGLLLLMQQANAQVTVSEEELFNS
ncbi:putative DNA-binding protein (UPF0278 family) [Aquimarina sp. EL_43]|uniref:hypothetical protein n=1 Tax=Aquimarina TaxID=290174 RepID=UPI00047149A2|nr:MULTISPECIES: hypothetical protein [Aquimarina]MBG6131569.1 putative DNA-binding protein (UPF0278 family) [Aquimarina sp. EL_35]MBG6152029.1 putative DNA-binding protein (UPF0278 family) [Aquimarina sp. EL_32]MBG6170027.1 putative DNA-binding protein (UPF0278 family) [Aquimarina sp. EL_43]